MTDLERSLELERAFSNTVNVVCELKTLNWNENNNARKNGIEPNTIFQNWIDKLEDVKKTIRKESDRAYLKHAETHPMKNEYGISCLAIAVLTQAAHDYEKALCSEGEDAENEIKDIEKFAIDEANIYTTLDFSEILQSIKHKREKFVRKAHKDIDSILFYTNKLRKHGFGDRYNPNRCPLCGGGMYAKGKQSVRKLTVLCTGCEMKEVVELGA